MSERGDADLDSEVVLGAVLVGAVVAVIGAGVPAAITLLNSGAVPRTTAVELLAGTVQVAADGRWSDPASAYPPAMHRAMPDPALWWALACAIVLTVALVAVVVFRRVEPLVARERLGRRRGDVRGARPRAWARPRDLAGETGDRGFTLGRMDGRTVAAGEEEHVALIAPTRAGKTTRCVIPWLLEHPGPAIVTSTKRDVLDATRAARAEIGPVWVFDPFARDSACWNPLAGCENWSHALRMAQWLVDATQDGDSEVARYWRGEAAKLLAPLLHAAARAGQTIERVLTWVDINNLKEPTTLLLAADAAAAARQLQAVARLDARNRATTFMSAGSAFRAYRFPEVLDGVGPEVTTSGVVNGAPATLYVVASERDQALLAPIIVALLASLIHRAIETDACAGDGMRLRVVLDEAANVAPLHDLPRLLSQAAGHGVRVSTVWQSLAQMRERYGRGADTILANSTTKMFMGPITDQDTRGYVQQLLGHSEREDDAKAGAAALQQLDRGRALVVRGSALPALVTPRPYWETRWRRPRA